MDSLDEQDEIKHVFNSAIKLYHHSAINNERYMKGNNNLVCSCTIGYGEHFIRITPVATKKRELIEAEIDWILFLSEKGVSVSSPIRSKGGKYVEEITYKQDIFSVVCFVKAAGRKVSFHDEEEDWNPQLIKNWGKITGEIHQLTRKYCPPLGSNSRPSRIAESNQLLNSISMLHKQDPDVVKQYYMVKNQIEGLSKINHYGLIHNDNHHGNFRVDKEWKITLFDFDECANFWFANELTIPLYDAIMDKCRLEVSRNNPIRNKYIKEFYTFFLDGYSQNYTVDDGLLKQIPIFLKIRDITRYIFMIDMFRNNEGLQQHLTELRMTIENELPFSEII